MGEFAWVGHMTAKPALMKVAYYDARKVAANVHRPPGGLVNTTARQERVRAHARFSYHLVAALCSSRSPVGLQAIATRMRVVRPAVHGQAFHLAIAIELIALCRGVAER
jgi:hypothetical protein